MKKLGKKILSFLCAVCMLSSSVGDLSVFAAKVPVVLTKELVSSDNTTYEITVRYEVEVPDDWDEERDGNYLDTLHVDLAVQEILAPAAEVPAEETEALTEKAEVPDEEAEAPAEVTEAPAEGTEAPAEEAEAPAEEAEAEAPAEEAEAPAEETEAPAEEAEAPAEEAAAPAEEAVAPAEEAAAPAEEAAAPAEEPEVPAEGAEAPAEETEAPAEEAEAHAEETEAPAEETEAPAEEAEVLAEEAEAPAENEYPYTYYEYVAKSVRALNYDAGSLKTARVFDISLIDTLTGEEIQPESSVSVSIRLLSEPLDTGSDVGVVHFGEDAPEVMETSVNGETVEFETESFSVYVVISHEGSATVTEPRIEFHFIDELYHDNSEAAYASLGAGEYQAAPYSFPNKGGSEQTTQILKSGEMLEMVKNPANITVLEYRQTTDTALDPTATYYTYDDGTETYTEVANPDVSEIAGYFERVPVDKYFFGWYAVDGEINSDAAVGSVGDIIYTWPVNPEQISFEYPLSITAGTDAHSPLQVGDKVEWSVNGLSGEAVLDAEGTAHVYLAPVFEDYYFINFHLGTRTDDQLKSSILARKLVVLGSDGMVTVRIGNVEAPSTNSTRFVFSGWETINDDNTTKTAYTAIAPEGGENDNHSSFPDVTVNGFYVTFSSDDFDSDKDVDLYPIFSEARWIYFNTGKSGNGAGYIGARYRITNDENAGTYYETFPVSIRPGYELEGWYIDAAVDNDGNITNLDDDALVTIKYFDAAGEEQTITEERTAHKLVNGDGSLADENYVNTVEGYKRFEVKNGKFYVYTGMERLTLYANWTAEETGYTVLYWLQNANDDDYTLMYYKTMQGVAGQQTAAAATQTTDTAEREVDGVMQTYYPYAEYKLKFAHLSTDQDKDKAGDQGAIQQQQIAGDGSTLVNVYYDRNLYTLRFDIGYSITENSGTTVDYPAMTASEAASYTGTVYGIVDGALVALTSDGNGGWLCSVDATNTAYGLVGGKYVPLSPGNVATTQLYKPVYRYSQTDADGDDLYAIDANGDYVLLEYTTSTVTGTEQKTIYELTGSLSAGNYLIVSRNNAGNGSALGHNDAAAASDGVTVRAAAAGYSSTLWIDGDEVDPTSVWTTAASGGNFTFKNGIYYIRNNNNNSLQISTTNNNNTWGYSSSRLRSNGNGRNIRYDNGFSISNTTSFVYLYRQNTITVSTSVTTYSYTLNGEPYANTLPRYTRSKNNSTTTYPETDTTHLAEHGGILCFHDTDGTYGAANAFIPAGEAGTETAVLDWTYGGAAYGDTIYMYTPYTGTLYKRETIAGKTTYYVSTLTNTDNYDDFPTSGGSPVGTEIPVDFIACGRKPSGNYTIYYYDLTAKYGETILNRYPGSQPVRPSVRFVGWIPQKDSYFWYTQKTSIKGYFETMSETLILTGAAYSNYNSGKHDLDPDTCTAVTAENGIAQEFHCRYQGSTNNYLYRIFLADPETRTYSSEPNDKFIVTAGTSSYPDMQTAPTYQGYGNGQGENVPAASYELAANGTKAALTHTYNNKSYAIPELTAAGVGNGMIIEFYFLPNEHTLTFKQADSTLIGEATYYYNQSLASADAYTAIAEENTPEGHVFAGWYENPDGVGSKFDFNSTMPDGNIVLYAIYTPIRYTIRIDPNGGEIDHINHNYDNNSANPSVAGYSGYWWNADESNAAPYKAGVYDYRPFATFNRGEILASDNVTVERPADSGYNRSAATSAAIAHGKTLSEYSVKRNYVPMSDAAAEEYAAAGGTIYYYVNTQYDPNIDGIGDGYGNKVGPPSDLRNALYMTEDELEKYYRFYSDWTRGNIIGNYIIGGVTVLGEGAWKNQYHITEQKYRKTFSGEHYEFLGWFKVEYDDNGNEIGVSDMPYNFSDPVTESFTIRAYWRLDAGYQILYNPEYTMADGTIINGKLYMDTWTDPAVEGAKYADGAKTQILQQPTGLTANGIATNDYIFLGWQVVSTDGKPLSDVTLDPGAAFTITAADADNHGIIHIQAVYEETDFSHRKPYVTNLTLDANGGCVTEGTYYNGDTLVKGAEVPDGETRILAWNSIGNVLLDADDDSISFTTVQTETAVHLYKYATELTQDKNGTPFYPAGKNYFAHPSEYLLLGFDEEFKPDGVTQDKGTDFVATYPADGIIAVTRNDDRTVYAVWEPMVYLNLYNETSYTDPNTGYTYPGGPVTFSLTSTSGDTLYIVNEKLGLYNRAEYPGVTGITLAPGESLKLAIPQGAYHDITVEGVNGISGYKLYENSYKHYGQPDQTARETGHLKDDATEDGTGYGYEYTLTDNLIVDSSGVDVVFTAIKQDYTLVLTDPKNKTGTEEIYFSYDQFTDPATNKYALDKTRAYTGWIFKGWDENADAVTPTYPVDGNGITDLMAFFHDTDIVILNAIWEVNASSTIVDIWKDIPLPGIQTKEFAFAVQMNAKIVKSASTTYELNSNCTQFALSDGQFLRIISDQHEGDPDSTKNDFSYISITIQKYDRDLDHPVGDPIVYRTTATYGGGTISNYLVTVTETTSADYTPTVTREASADQDNFPITVANTPSASWNNANAGGTVVFHNTRKTADVVVKKTLTDPINTNPSAAFRVTVTNADNFVLPAGDKSFTLGDAGTKVIKDVPVGAIVTVVETKDDDYETTATLKNTESGTAIYDGDSSVYSMSFLLPQGGATAVFVNVLKSYPVKIVKIGWNGSTESTNVESQFSLTRGSVTIVDKKYTTPTNNVIFDGSLYVADYMLEELWVDDGYRKLDQPLQKITVSGNGTVTIPDYTTQTNGSLVDPTGHIVISGNETSGFLVKVYNEKTVDIKIAKKLIDPLISTTRTFYFDLSYNYTLNGVSAGESLSGDKAIAVTSGSSTVVTVPVGATGLRIAEDTARLANETDPIASTYDTTCQYKDGAAVAGTAYTYAAAVSDANKGDVITFTNTRRTVNVTISKTVIADDTSGTFTYDVKVLNGALPIKNYTVNDGGTETNPDDDWVTDDTGLVKLPGDAPFTLTHGGAAKTVIIPVGATILVEEKLTDAQSEKGYAVFMTMPGRKTTLVDGRSDKVQIIGPTEDQTIRVFNIPAICKVTDEDGNLLYVLQEGADTPLDTSDDIYIPAVFPTIKGAFEGRKETQNGNMVQIGGLGNYYPENSTTKYPATSQHQIQMLVDYQVPNNDVVVVDAGYDMVFTTAALDAADGYPFHRTGAFTGTLPSGLNANESIGKAVLTRPDNATAAFFTAGTADGDTATVFKMSKLILDGGNASLTAKGGVLTAYNAEVTIEDCVIFRFKAAQGGAVYTTGDSLTVTDSIFDHCISGKTGNGNGGGGINTTADTLTITDTVFQSCNAVHQGGAVYQYQYLNNVMNETGKTMTLSGCSFIDCTSRSGGAVEADVTNVDVSDCTFLRCIADGTTPNSGGNGGGLNAFYEFADPDSTVTVSGCTFRGCAAILNKADGGNGGALRSMAQTTTLTDCIFADDPDDATAHCRATRGGGAAFTPKAANGTATVAGCTFTNCTAAESGGAIYYEANVALTVRKSDNGQTSITGCSAASGGGIYAKGNLTLQNGTSVTGNLLLAGDAAVDTDAAGIYLSDGKTLTIGDGTSAAVTLNVTGNTMADGTTPSNLRLPMSGGENANCVSIQSPLAAASRIGVVNACAVLTRFGTIKADYSGMSVLTLEDAGFTKIFVADDGSLFGCIEPDDPDHAHVFWFGVVCKITDADGNLLYYDGKEAVFLSLGAAFTTFGNKSFTYQGGTGSPTPVYIKMLVGGYTIQKDAGITVNTSKPITLTTEQSVDPDNTDGYPYFGQYTDANELKRCTLARASDNVTALFTVGTGASLTITNLIVDGKNVNVNGVDTGLLYVNGALTLTNGAELVNGKAQRSSSARAGAIYVAKTGNLVMTGDASIHNCIGRSAGAVYCIGSFTMEGNARIYNCEAKRQGSYGGNGGAVALGQEISKTYYYGTMIQQGNSEISGCTAEYNGGAVFVEYGYYELKGNARISGCTAKAGAGIYVSDYTHNNALIAGTASTSARTTLKLSGSPTFGSGTAANTVSVTGYSGETNGGESVYTGNKARQDIFIAGFSGTDVASVQVTGNLTSGDGAIWVWAEKEDHYQFEDQFAVFTDGVTDKENTFKAFRNARHDGETNNPLASEGIKYLFGVQGEGSFIVWGVVAEGSRRVILRKVNSTYGQVADAAFTIWKGETKIKATDINGNENAESFASGASGVFFSGVMEYGTYYLQETAAPSPYESNVGKWFCLIVDKTGVFMSGGFADKEAAHAAALAIMP